MSESIALVGGHRVLRQSLAEALQQIGDFRVSGQADSLARSGELFDEEPPALLLIDADSFDPESPEKVRALKEAHAGIAMVAHGLDSERQALRYIAAGFDGYVFKESSLDELKQVIRLALEGKARCSPSVAGTLFAELADLDRSRRSRHQLDSLVLSPREIEILQLIADGLSNQEIADKLFLSFHTVKNHVHHILGKLRVDRRSAAVAKAYRKHWLPGRRDSNDSEPSNDR